MKVEGCQKRRLNGHSRRGLGKPSRQAGRPVEDRRQAANRLCQEDLTAQRADASSGRLKWKTTDFTDNTDRENGLTTVRTEFGSRRPDPHHPGQAVRGSSRNEPFRFAPNGSVFHPLLLSRQSQALPSGRNVSSSGQCTGSAFPLVRPQVPEKGKNQVALSPSGSLPSLARSPVGGSK